jgi:hypothetical protein
MLVALPSTASNERMEPFADVLNKRGTEGYALRPNDRQIRWFAHCGPNSGGERHGNRIQVPFPRRR